uniref:Coiled-coil domain containing 12 n=1 Tax=Equus asinus asinus TaxID=83772 RepID=A0A8C4PK45_EQUAS
MGRKASCAPASPGPRGCPRRPGARGGYGKIQSSRPFKNHTLDISRQLSHFTTGELGAEMIPNWSSGLCLLQLPPAGPPSPQDCLHPGKLQPFLQTCLCRGFASGWFGAKGRDRGKKAQDLPGDLPAPSSPLRQLQCAVSYCSVAAEWAPFPQASIVVLHPLVEEKVKEQLEAAKPEPVIEEVDLANLAPRKPDWDLKRDVAKKLEKLEKRTQRAIAELIRERLKGQEDSLASAVDANTEQEACDSD